MGDESDNKRPADDRELKQRALKELRRLRAKVDELEGARSEPIAITGLWCRFPGGATDPERFWDLLASGGDGISGIPSQRWDHVALYDRDPDAQGKYYARHGGFIDGPELFDAAFFGISPVEARSIDPQQRILLEVVWNALEDACLPPSALSGRPVGVFVGVGFDDYALARLESSSLSGINAFTGGGGFLAVTAGRVSYVLGLQGPCLAVDTACSSSLVSVHLACQSLRAGECELALAAGVNLMVAPDNFVALSKARALSPDGRCSTFDAGANGYVRGEGCGVVVLKRLSDAVAAGDRVRAVIRGSAVNQDGRSSAFTAPSGRAQEAVIRAALASGNVDPGDVGYVECHGTGTVLGDPIEVRALANVYARGRPEGQRLAVGSVKTNIGHLETAAGVAGLIKLVLSLEDGQIPPHLHLRRLNPGFGSTFRFAVPTTLTPWRAPAGKRLAAVSSFGMSGTNAHVVLEQGPPAEAPRQPGGWQLLPISARTQGALEELAAAYDHWFAGQERDFSDVCRTAQSGRSHLERRLAIVAEDPKAARRALREIVAGRRFPGSVAGRVEHLGQPDLALLFAGRAGWSRGAGQELFQESAVFRAAIERCCAAYPGPDKDLLDALGYGSAGDARPELAEVAAFAFGCAAAEMWRSLGILPSAVMGHGTGEYVAACVAGILELEGGLRLSLARGRLLAQAPAGVVVGVVAGAERVRDVTGRASDVRVAAINGPESVVIAGTGRAVGDAVDALTRQGIRVVPLTTVQLAPDASLEQLEREAESLVYSAPTITFVSSLTGRPEPDVPRSPRYWSRQLTETLRLDLGFRSVVDAGVAAAVEVGSRSGLACLGRLAVPDVEMAWLSTPLSGQREWRSVLETVGKLYVRGVEPSWAALTSGGPAPRAPAPTYPFQRKRFWMTDGPRLWEPRGSRDGDVQETGALLGRRVAGTAELTFETRWSATSPGLMADHRFFGLTVVSATTLLEAMVEAARKVSPEPVAIEGFEVEEALLLDGERERAVRVVAAPEGDRRHRLEILSLEGDGHWTSHARARVVPWSPGSARHVDLAALIASLATSPLCGDTLYRRLLASGIEFGSQFQPIEQTWTGDDQVLVHIRRRAGGDEAANLVFHPGHVDGGFQAAGALLDPEQERDASSPLLPAGLSTFRLHTPVADDLWCHLRRRSSSDDVGRVLCDLHYYDGHGRLVLEVEGFTAKATPRRNLLRLGQRRVRELLYEPHWRSAPPVARADDATGHWVVVHQGTGLGRALADSLHRLGASVVETTVEAFGERTWPREAAVVHVPVATGLEEAAASIVQLVQIVKTMLAQRISGGLALLTRGAQITGGESVAAVPWHAALVGLCRTARLEHPELHVKAVDVDDEAGAAPDVVAELLARGESEVVLRGGERFVRRMARWSSTDAGDVEIRGDLSYLVTGGLGGMGLEVARWLVERGGRHLVLLGRSAPGPAAEEAVARLEEAGAAITTVRCDVSSRAALTEVFAAFGKGRPPLGGVIHAAGVVDDALLASQTADRLSAVLKPKVQGAWNLHELTSALQLDFFVMFSSQAALLGNPGQAGYSAGNAFMDALAHHRRAAGLPATSINWGPWGEVGMAAGMSAGAAQQLRDLGVEQMTVREGLVALELALSSGRAQVAAQRVDWTRLVGALGAEERPFLEEVVPKSAQPGVRRSAHPGLSAEEQRSRVLDRLRAITAKLLGIEDPSGLDVDQPLMDMGVDSLLAVELRNELRKSFEISLPATLAFDYPTLDALAGHLSQTLFPEDRMVTPAAEPSRSDEPVAIIAVACRFPGGVNTPEDYWRLLSGGVDAIRDVPRGRWDVERHYDPDPDAPGKMYTKWAGFIDGVDQFDARFFGISPPEAAAMDPQQRFLLEVSWEALERAGHAPGQPSPDVGVYFGVASGDYLGMRLDPRGINIFSFTGTFASVAPGRVSFALGLQGPSLAVDTACSSSLVALHLAVQGIRQGECRMALAGGVNMMLSPMGLIGFSKLRVLSPDGRCKTFDARADGYARGEGCGVLVLKRYSDAVADGDNILALVLGSAVNQDGRSSALTAPNGPAQQSVFRKALASAGVEPGEVSYIEAHGTGTALGDPIEAQSISAVFGREGGRRVAVGSAKTNIGHLEPAAGVAGLIKLVLMLQHEEIPPHLHLERMNPHISLAESAFVVPTRRTPWRRGARRRVCGVSGFAFMGTNAHAVLAEAPVLEREEPQVERPGHVLCLSARSEAGLDALARRHAAHLAETRDSVGDICFTAAVGRRHFAHRLAVVGGSAAELSRRLSQALAGEAATGVARGEKGRGEAKVGVVFGGVGSARAGMGLELYATEPAFRAALERVGAVYRSQLGVALLEVLADEGRLRDPEHGEPALVALELALWELLRGWGLSAAAVVGHGLGEVAAACASRVLELEAAIRLAAARGRMHGALPPGAMVAAQGLPEQVLPPVTGRPGVSVAAINPGSVLLSGEARTLGEVGSELAARGVTTRPLSARAYQSPLLEPLLGTLDEALLALEQGLPEVPLYSTLSGREEGEGAFDAEHWRRQAREPVRYAEALAAMAGAGVALFVELSPGGALAGLARSGGAAGQWISTLRADRSEWEGLLGALARLYAVGVELDWQAFDAPHDRRRVALPTYRFEHQRYWIEPADEARARDTGAPPGPRLTRRASPIPELEARWSAEEPAWLAEHRVHGSVVVAGATYITLLLEAALEVLGESSVTLEELVFLEPLSLGQGEACTIQVTFLPGGTGTGQQVMISSQRVGESSWQVHVKGRAVGGGTAGTVDLARLRRSCPERVDVSRLYSDMDTLGLGYGEPFRRLRELWRGREGVLGLVEQPEGDDYPLFPGALDSCFQSLYGTAGALEGDPLVPFGIDRLVFHRAPGSRFWCHGRLGGAPGGTERRADLQLVEDSGEVVVSVEGFRARRVSPAVLARAGQRSSGLYYAIEWREAPRPKAAESEGTWLLVADAVELAGSLQERGAPTIELGALAAEAEEVRGQLGQALEAREGPLHVVYASRGEDASERSSVELLHLVQGLAALERPVGSELVVLSSGAQGPGPVSPAQSPLLGLGRTVRLEHPELGVRLIDVVEGSVVAELLAPDSQEEVVVRGERRFVRRLARLDVPPVTVAPPLREDRSYLVTGGLGALGLHVARWVVERGGRHLVLADRSAPGERAREAIAALEPSGATVRVVETDITQESAVEALMAQDPPLGGVVHAAGVLDDGLLRSQSRERFTTVFAPKVSGAWNLHRATQDRKLDFFFLFSSQAALLGNVGQGSYTAANAFLDGLAQHRQEQGLAATSLSFGPWRGLGMAAGVDEARMREQGVGAIALEDGLGGLDIALGGELAQVAILDVDWDRLAGVLPWAAETLLAKLVTRQRAPERKARAPLVASLAEAPPEKRRARLVRELQEIAAGLLGIEDASAVDAQMPLMELGIDSLLAVELRDRLNQSFGVSVPPTAAFDYPTLDALVGYLEAQLLPGEAPRVEAAPAPEARTEDDPVAIVGMACRFPGAGSPGALWRLLQGGVDAIREVPAERWDVERYYDPDPDAPGKMYTKWGGFMEGVDRFDARFFGISPAEAATMDPQQRLLLEVSWEALEHAGLTPGQEPSTGVFMALSTYDYPGMQLKRNRPDDINVYFAPGGSLGVAAGRLSYSYGFQGPSLVVDTACSSSLVTLHLAAQSLQRGECRMALSGGVNLLLSPETMIGFSKLRALSPDGRCKTFDARADGYTRAEGCGVLVLKRYSDAVADGDNILALVLGSAVNQDGRSSALTAPNGPAQQAVFRKALASAGVEAGEVSYLEAHGTGTALGDPIEAQSISAVFGREDGRRVAVGSIKTNIGHLEPAASVAGLIKLVLMLQHEEIPPHLHLERMNPHISLAESAFVVPTRRTPWRRGARRRVCGVSGFAFMGTNAHAVLAEAPVLERERSGVDRPGHVLCLSARSEAGLDALARRHAAHLGETGQDAGDICFTAAVGRRHFAHRLAVVGGSAAELSRRLSQALAGEAATGVARGEKGRGETRVGVVFGGVGSERAGMGLELYATEPAFRGALERAGAVYQSQVGVALLEVLADEGRLRDPEHGEPALVALELALWELLRGWGLSAAAVVGHGLGEVAAACASGVLELEAAIRLAAARGRMHGALPPGAMVAAQGLPEQVLPPVTGRPGVSVAAINPGSVVLSGEARALAEVGSELAGRGVTTRPLSARAYQSPLLESSLGTLDEALLALEQGLPEVPLYSTLSGREEGEGAFDAEHWRRQVREPVRYAEALAAMARAGVGVFVELSPGGALAGLARSGGAAGQWVSTLRADRPEGEALLGALARLYAVGVDLDWRAFDAPHDRRRVALPTYPFEQQRYWIEPAETAEAAVARGEGPFLARRLESALPLFEARWSAERPGWLGDHRVYEVPVVAGATFVGLLLQGAAEVLETERLVLEGVSFLEPLALTGDERVVQLALVPRLDGGLEATVSSRPVSAPREAPWRTHVRARVLAGAEETGPSPDLDALKQRCGRPVDVEGHYELMNRIGLGYRGAFRRLQGLWRGPGEVLGLLERPDLDEVPLVHPGVLDGCFQALMGCGLDDAPLDAPLVPFEIERLALCGDLPRQAWCHARLLGSGASAATHRGAFVVFGDDGGPALTIDGFTARKAPREAILRALQADVAADVYEVRWQPEPRVESDAGAPRSWVILDDGQGMGRAVAGLLERRGQRALLLGSDGSERERLAEALEGEARSAGLPLAIVHLAGVGLGALPGVDPLERLRVPCESLVSAALALAQIPATTRPEVWTVTRGAQAARPDEVPLAWQAPLLGIARTVSQEHPMVRSVRIDLPATGDAMGLARLLVERLLHGAGEDEAALRSGGALVPRLRRRASGRRVEPELSPGAYLVTGGLGGLGLALCDWLVQRGVTSLVLMSRGRPSAEAVERISALRKRGADVAIVRGDVAVREDVGRAVAACPGGAPLRGVFHVAGALDDCMLAQLSWDRFVGVLRPKVLGAWNLHELALDHPELEHFVLYSSQASLMGNAGQASYAAANAFLDALAHSRAGNGRPAVAVNWGLWAGPGMAATLSEAQRRQLAERGAHLMDADEALGLLGGVLSEPASPQVAITRMDWSAVARSLPAGQAPPLLEKRLPRRRAAAPKTGALSAHLEAAAGEDRAGSVRAFLVDLAARELGLSPGDLDPDQPLNTLGLDSLQFTELRNRIMQSSGVEVSMTILMEGISLAGLAEHIAERLPAAATAPAAPPAAFSAQAAVPETAPEVAQAPASASQTLAGLDPDLLLSRMDDFNDGEVEALLGLLEEGAPVDEAVARGILVKLDLLPVEEAAEEVAPEVQPPAAPAVVRAAATPLGVWTPSGATRPVFAGPDLTALLQRTGEPLFVVQGDTGSGLAPAAGGQLRQSGEGYPVLAVAPAVAPRSLGDPSFNIVHGTRIAYIAGAMAQGVSSAELVVAMARAGGVGFFGAGGLALDEVARGLRRIRESLGDDAKRLPWGANLLHAPHDPAVEDAVVDLYLRSGVRRVSASAFMRLTPAVVRFAATGLSLAPDGQLRRQNHVLAKLSSDKVAQLFLSPPPADLVEGLVGRGQLSRAEADLALRFPLAEDITVEADSGGHTDNRPLSAILPVILALRDQLAARLGHGRRVRVGAAGGLGTPGAVAAAFALGADYVLTGSVNQAAVESALSGAGKQMLLAAGVSDVTMAPSADMFEMGVKVQVLKRGTLFAARGARLFDLYTRHGGLDQIPAADRQRLEKDLFKAPLESVWKETREFFAKRSPAVVERAEREPKLKMALVFRWYLGNASRWAIAGAAERRTDYQIWCGPAMGAFNTWVAGSFLEPLESRTVAQIAWNLMQGAAVLTRAQLLRSQGVPLPPEAFDFRPRRIEPTD